MSPRVDHINISQVPISAILLCRWWFINNTLYSLRRFIECCFKSCYLSRFTAYCRYYIDVFTCFCFCFSSYIPVQFIYLYTFGKVFNIIWFFLSNYRHSLYSCPIPFLLLARLLRNSTFLSPFPLSLRDILCFSGLSYMQLHIPYTCSVVCPSDYIPSLLDFRASHILDIFFFRLSFAFSFFYYITMHAFCPLPNVLYYIR